MISDQLGPTYGPGVVQIVCSSSSRLISNLERIGPTKRASCCSLAKRCRNSSASFSWRAAAGQQFCVFKLCVCKFGEAQRKRTLGKGGVEDPCLGLGFRV